jgi:hypothetical protein
LNLKRKVVLKRSLKKNLTSLPFGPNGPAAHRPSPLTGPPLPLSFLFFCCRSHLGPTRQPLHLPLPFLLPPARRPAAAAVRIPPRPAFSPSFFSLASLPIKAFNRPGTIGAVSPFLAPSRDGRGHQWQAPPRSPPSSLRLLPALLFKHALELLRLPLHTQHTNARN